MTSAIASDDTQPRNQTPAFVVCIVVAGLTILDVSGVNVALPSIQKGLGASSGELQLIVAGYALAFGLALVPAGRLGDTWSRRRMFVIGLAGFAGASALCALAPTHDWLTVTRFIQGFAAGVQMPQVLGMIQQLFRGPARGRAFGVFGAMVGVSTAFGPTICGALIQLGGEHDGWRLLFWLNVPIGVIALILAIKLLPTTQKTGQDRGLDPIGLLLLGVSVFCLMLPFLLTSGGNGDDPARWWWLAGSAVGVATFIWWERAYKRRGRSPVMHFELFRRSSYRNGLLVTSTYFAGMPASFLVNTLYLQEGLKITPLGAGLVSVPFAMGSAAAAFVGGRLVNRVGRLLVVIGVCIVGAGIVLLMLAATLTPPATTEWWMAGAMLIGGCGGGLVISPNQTLTLSEVPPDQGSVAGSLVQLGQRIGTAVGVSAITSLFFAAVASGRPTVADYHHAVFVGYLACLGMLALALLFGLFDLVQRHRAGRGHSSDAVGTTSRSQPRDDSVRAEPGHSDAAHDGSARNEPTRGDPARGEPARGEPAHDGDAAARHSPGKHVGVGAVAGAHAAAHVTAHVGQHVTETTHPHGADPQMDVSDSPTDDNDSPINDDDSPKHRLSYGSR